MSLGIDDGCADSDGPALGFEDGLLDNEGDPLTLGIDGGIDFDAFVAVDDNSDIDVKFSSKAKAT